MAAYRYPNNIWINLLPINLGPCPRNNFQKTEINTYISKNPKFQIWGIYQRNQIVWKAGVHVFLSGATVANKKLTVKINWKLFSGLVRMLCIVHWNMNSILFFFIEVLNFSQHLLIELLVFEKKLPCILFSFYIWNTGPIHNHLFYKNVRWTFSFSLFLHSFLHRKIRQ